jgi:hypothetical protein
MVPLLQRVTFVKAGIPASVVDGAIPDQKQGRGGLRADRIPNVGGGLLPIAVVQLQLCWLTYRHREQAPSHSLISIDQTDRS